MLVAYSLGNFLSRQRGAAQYGMLLDLVIGEDAQGVFLSRAAPHMLKNRRRFQQMGVALLTNDIRRDIVLRRPRKR